MKYPLKVLVGLYLFNVLAVGYLVYAFERANGTCTAYVDVVWMMGVTITNLGFGDFTPSFWGAFSMGGSIFIRARQDFQLQNQDPPSWYRIGNLILKLVCFLQLFDLSASLGVKRHF